MAQQKQIKKAKLDLPYNEQAERAVLGSALLSSDALYTVLSYLTEEDFFEGRHQLIFRALWQLRERNINADTLTVTEELLNMKELDNIGGVDYLQECCDSMVAIANLDYYISIVNDQSCLRRLLVTIRDIDKKYHTEEIPDINSFLLDSEEEIKIATEKRRVSQFKETKQVAPEVESIISNARELEEGDVIGLNTGFTRVNDITQGFQKGNLIILAARPAVGKTALALNFAYRVATRAKKPVAIFSLEMPSEALVTRLLGSESFIPLRNLTTGKLSGEQRIKLSDAVRRVSAAPIYIDDTPGNKLMNIIAKCRKLQAKVPDLAFVVVDYLGLVEAGSKGADSRQEEVRKISLALKQLALELKIPVLALSQLSRLVEREKRRPVMSDLRDSGSIEQDADVVMLMHREDYNSNKDEASQKKIADMSLEERKKMSLGQQKQMLVSQMSGSNEGDASYVELNIAKNRNGQTGRVGLFFYKTYGRFEDPPKEWEQQMRELLEKSEIVD